MGEYLRFVAFLALLSLGKSTDPEPPTIKYAELLEGNVRSDLPKQSECSSSDPTGFSKCSDDCNSRIFCENVTMFKEEACPEEAPFCDAKTGSCAAKPSECQVKEPCVGPKYYQDLTECRKFSYCDGKYSFSYRCLGAFVWDPETETCRELACFSFSNSRHGLCKDKEDQFVAYPANLTKYIYCGSNNKPQLLYCGENQIFNALAQACQFSCPGFGKYPDPNGENAYYECVKHDKIVNANYIECGDQIYDVKEQMCISPKKVLNLTQK